MKGFVIAGTNSGCGKTTLALGLMAAFVERDIPVYPFKVGPDFIDPGHHTRITGITSRNLDGWMLSKQYNQGLFQKQIAATNGIAVVEGVMGLFDGYEGVNESGSTAQMAKWLDLPVVLVVNVHGMARSAAAMVQGFENFDEDLRFAGVIFNNIGSPRHLTYLKDALSGHVRMPILGGILRDKGLEIPERHLGLVTTDEFFLSADHIKRLVDIVESGIDIDAFVERLPERRIEPASPGESSGKKPTVRIAVAKDSAFCFYYRDNIDELESSGAEIVYFSPIFDAKLPDDIDGLYFGGGYPEVFAEELAKNIKLRNQIKVKSLMGMPIYGECGGFMYLCEELQDIDGKIHPMTGCFPFRTRMRSHLISLGYREIELMADCIIGTKGTLIRGHEFHYSEIIEDAHDKEIPLNYQVSSARRTNVPFEGYHTRNTLGSYIHLHFGSRPEAAKAFVDASGKFRTERMSADNMKNNS